MAILRQMMIFPAFPVPSPKLQMGQKFVLWATFNNVYFEYGNFMGDDN